ncbi:unnamed protein product [Blepharisma stoltei]|uniref:Uncharacterized protein n=1 Tax=Blepharisma stoltei TaxID=1481888 RepID=A0AAU9K7Q9_9CILI|nr:unnamed protein product [Blepharisma stoltei]
MEDSPRLTEERRKEILENLRKEREKRREMLTKGENIEGSYNNTPQSSNKNVGSTLRSETLNKLLQERRETMEQGQNLLDWTKQKLQENVREEKDYRNYLSGSGSECPTPRKKPTAIASSPRSEISIKKEVPMSKTKEVPKKAEKPEPAKPPTKRKVPNPRPSSAPPRKNQEKPKPSAQPTYNQECTFKPKINPLPQTKELNYNKPKSQDFDSRIDELSKPKSETIKKREKERLAKEKEAEKSCPFKPQISPYPMKRQDEPVEERLIKLGEERAKSREKLLREKEMNEMITHSFTPKISSESEKIAKKKPPIYKRIFEIQKEKNNEMEKLRLENEKGSEMAFQPRINPKSERIAEYKKRLEEQGEVLRKTRSIDEYRKEESEKYTFSPKISARTNGKGFEEFLERQEEFKLKIKEKTQQNITKWQSDEYTFAPTINPSSRQMAQNIDKSYDDKLDRIGKDEHERRENKKAMIQQEYYSKFTYEPEINQLSKALGRAVSLEELAYDEEGKIKKRLLAGALTAEKEQACTFKPEINKNKYTGIRSKYTDPENVLDNIHEELNKKNEKIEAHRSIKDSEELKDCTFKPQINTPKPQTAKPIVVSGLDRFLELKELKKRYDEEKKEREEKVFGLKNKNNWDHYYTVPQPFNLTTANKEENLKKLKQERLEEEMRECTFKPNTMESKNLQAISRILGDSFLHLKVW